MTLLAIDAGTTHCKAGLFDEEGSALALATRPTPTQRSAEGYAYDPEALWQQVVRAIQDVLQQHPATVTGIGVSSMAETGLLLDDTGVARTEFIPWFDRRTVPQADRLRRLCDIQERFYITGMRPSYKSAVAKLLWLQEQDAELLMGATWLSVADYLAFRLTGTRATDYSLAGRTYRHSHRQSAAGNRCRHRPVARRFRRHRWARPRLRRFCRGSHPLAHHLRFDGHRRNADGRADPARAARQ